MAIQYQVTGGTAAEIAASVEEGVRSGQLAPGAMLPTVRALAATLRVSPATVAAAYRALRQRGLVETGGRNGTRVRHRPPVSGARSASRLPAPAGGRDLSEGSPDARLLPSLHRHLRQLSGRDRLTGYAAGGPLPELVAEARRRLVADAVPADARGAALTVTGGALDGIERLLATHLHPGDPVAVEDPGWANLLDLVAALGLQPAAVPVDEEGPSPDGLARALAAGAQAVIITTRAHNPTGAAITAGRARALAPILRRHRHTLLIEDDHAAELAGVPLHALAGATDAWAFVRSVSKPYGPDLRLAALAGDEATVARVEGRMRLGTGWVSHLLQRLVLRLWQDPAVADGLVQAADSYRRRRETLVSALRERGLAATARTGLNVWVPVPDETRAVAALREAGYAVAPGALFRVASGPGIRITVSRLDEPELPALAAAVTAAVTLDTRAPLSA